MEVFDDLNSPLQYIDTLNGIEVWLKREDLIHREVSGNKWRKLKYYLKDFRESGKAAISTFGGAFSNHIAATAAIGHLLDIPTKAFVRGEEIKTNPTLEFCRSCNMKLEMISREEYARKEDNEFLADRAGADYIIPEGGKGVLGIKGCVEILEDADPGFTHICCAAGTGTTFLGLLLSKYDASYRMYPALKGASFLRRDIANYKSLYLKTFSTEDNGKISNAQPYLLIEDYHFGGYGKTSPELIDFMNGFYRSYKIPLDPVYTGKMLFGIVNDIKRDEFEKGSKILAIHTGGLQGIKGMNQRLKKSGNILKYEI